MDKVTDEKLLNAVREYIENPQSTKLSAAKIGGMSSKTFQSNIGRIKLIDPSLFEEFEKTSVRKSTSGRISRMDIDKVLDAALIYISSNDTNLEQAAHIAGISERGLQLNISMLEEKYGEILEMFNATKELKVKNARSRGGKIGSSNRDYSKSERPIDMEDIQLKLVNNDMSLRSISTITEIPKSTIHDHLLRKTNPNSEVGIIIRKTLAAHQSKKDTKENNALLNFDDDCNREKVDVQDGKKSK